MKTGIAIGVIAGFLLGLLGRSILPKQSDIAQHWRIVRDYRTHVLDRSNYTPDPQTGLLMTKPPNDPMPSLAALVSAGELRHIDIVLPTVPYKDRGAVKYWKDFCEKHEGIMYAEGNPSYVAFPIKGEPPLHLNIWFEDSAQSDVQRLIKTLEDMGTKERPTSTSIVSPERTPSPGT